MTTVVAAIISRDSRILICQRRADNAFPLKWEFPGGKVEPDESLADALIREIMEELSVEIEVGSQVYRTQFRYAELSAPIEIVFFSARIADAAKFAKVSAGAAFNQIKWVRAAELTHYDFLAANAELIAKIAGGQIPLG